MKYVAALVVVVLLLAVHAGAETYFWTDDNGTTNFTDDMSNVPRKYRPKVKRASEPDASMNEPVSQEKGSTPAVTERPAVVEKKAGTAPGGGQEYEGKTLEVWRTELSQKEAELNRMKQQLEKIKSEIDDPNVEERNRLTREYNELTESFNYKFGEYKDSIERLRKAGLITGSNK